MMGWVTRKMHRLHRWSGTALCVLLATWFASGAVMAVAPFPRFSEEERLASARALPAGELGVPEDVVKAVMGGKRVRLANVEGQATWMVGDRAFDRVRAQREIEARFGPVAWIERLDALDQWSVPQRQLPLYRAGFANGDQAYLAARSGEIVQYTSQRERVLAWFGAIPHWVYFTWLREQRALWRYTVLTLATCGMFVTVSGLVAGISVTRRLKKKLRDPVLRWHQWLGLGFGLLAFSWLFSGALSLTPFRWSDSEPPRDLFVAGVAPSASNVSAALKACGDALELRELELAPFAGRTYAVCAARDATRIVDLADATPRASLLPDVLPGATLEHKADAYFYARHDQTFPATYLRQIRPDAAGTTVYVDPARARLLTYTTDLLRLERWLYSGLHSLELPGLYDRPSLWLATIWSAMAVGFVLSTLGGVLAWRRHRRSFGVVRARQPLARGTD